MIDALRIDLIMKEVGLELGQVTAKFGQFNSSYEGYAVLKEEVDELWDDIKTNAPFQHQRKEAIQIAAMAIRYILDVTGGPWVEPSREDDNTKQADRPGPEYHKMMEDLYKKHELGDAK